jgi:predicted MPP superfamily phosphohydrolase
VRGERRDDRARHTLEMFLDRVFAPLRWAARAADAVGAQTARPIDVEEILLPVGREPGHPPLKIAFASDFHAGPTTNPRVLEAACEALVSLRPDLLLLGGDFVTGRASYIQELAPLLATIPAPLGRYGVWGNHDLRAHRNTLQRALEDAGVRMLHNEAVPLPAPHDDVSLIGIDDPICGKPAFPESGRPVKIVLMHAPDGLLSIGENHFDLALCGHTHGGQIVFGREIRPYLPAGKLSRRYASGLFRTGARSERALIVSNGIGCSTVPFRLGARSQVHLITLG